MMDSSATMLSPARSGRPCKRLTPSFWEHDWYVLKSLRSCIESILTRDCLREDARVVVDMGCGDCPYEPLFRQPNCTYLRGDLQGDVDFLIEPGRPVDLADASADGVVSIQVLEHVWDLDWYLGECHRILNPGGWLLLSTHGTWPYHAHPTDFRRWTREGLMAELRQRHFAVERIESVVGPLAWTTQIRLLGIRHLLESLGTFGKITLRPVLLIMNLRMVLEDKLTPSAIRDENACVYVTLSRK
ncbi:MAG: class I SAM-dependent methyltransferase [Isosphaeraceae bacterium]